jgi:DNA-binding HxlR family transcriptional regulator
MTRKSYRQFCGVAHALDRLGERWTLLIVRNLLLGPRRYSDLLNDLPGITTNLLAKRLRELEDSQVIDRRLLPAPLGVSVYGLTDSGRALEPVIMELGRWGGRFMTAPTRGERFDLGWAFLSLKRRYRGGLSCSVLVEAGERSFTLDFSQHSMKVEERKSEHPDLCLRADQATIIALFFRNAPWSELVSSGKLRSSGPKPLERALQRAFDQAAAAGLREASANQRPATTRRKLSSKNSSVASKPAV